GLGVGDGLRVRHEAPVLVSDGCADGLIEGLHRSSLGPNGRTAPVRVILMRTQPTWTCRTTWPIWRANAPRRTWTIIPGMNCTLVTPSVAASVSRWANRSRSSTRCKGGLFGP